MGANLEIKVSDFGLSRTLRNTCVTQGSRNNVGTAQYTAPEVLRSEPYSKACDVWSFGVVLWELFMNQVGACRECGGSCS